MIIRLIAILTLLSPALLGWGVASNAERSCCGPETMVDSASADHCAAPALVQRCDAATRSVLHGCCSDATVCTCGLRDAPAEPAAPKAPLPSRTNRDVTATISHHRVEVGFNFDHFAGLAAQRPGATVVLTSLRRNNEALSMLGIWRT